MNAQDVRTVRLVINSDQAKQKLDDKLSHYSRRRIPKVYCHTLAPLQRLERQGRRAHAAAHSRR